MLLINGNRSAWRNLTLTGTVASGLLPVLLIGVALTRRKFTQLHLGSTLIYAFALSNMMLAYLGFAYNL